MKEIQEITTKSKAFSALVVNKNKDIVFLSL
jgi:hypothetical protein